MTLSDLFPVPHILTSFLFLALIGFLIKASYVYRLRIFIFNCCRDAEKLCLKEMNDLENTGLFGLILEAKLENNENLKVVQEFVNIKYNALASISNKIDFYGKYLDTLPRYYQMLLFRWNFIGLKKKILDNILIDKDLILRELHFIKTAQDECLDLIERTKSGL